MARLALIGAICAAVLSSTAVAGEEIQVLRGAQPSLHAAFAGVADVVVLRGAQVGGPIPPPEPAKPAVPVAPPPPPAPVVQVFVGPVVSQSAPVAVWPAGPRWHRRPPAHAPPSRAVWPHPGRPGRGLR